MTRLYSRSIILSSVRLEGYIKVGDNFQILPFENITEAPPDFHYPAILEYSYTLPGAQFYKNERQEGNEVPVPDNLIKLHTQFTWRDEILILLSVITNYRFFQYRADKGWFVPLGENGYKSDSSEWGIKTFLRPSLVLECDMDYLSEPLCKEVERINFEDYYFGSIFGFANSPISIPSNIEELTNAIWALTSDAREAFTAACALFCNGIDLRNYMPSLSNAAFISSIETLINFDRRNEKKEFCSHCGQQAHKVRKSFLSFVEQYVSTSREARKYADALYGIRSNLLHAGQLLLADAFWKTTPWDVAPGEYSSSDEIPWLKEDLKYVQGLMMFTRICLVMWLLNHK